MPRLPRGLLPRGLLFGAFVLVLLLGALSSLAVVTTRQSFPSYSGTESLAGLSSQVEVLRDEYGVPHVYADTPEDLFMAQGYVQAQDRFFEMDFRRHVVAGRLSEWFGPSQYATDAFVRTLGWRRVTETELGLLSSSTRRYLDAYSAGVNAYLDEQGGTGVSLEFSVLGLTGVDYTPEQWSPVDSLGWIKAMAYELGGNSDQEAELARVSALFGEGRARQLWPVADPEEHRPILSGGAVRDKVFQPDATGNGRPSIAADTAEPATALPAAAVPAAALPALARASTTTETLGQLFGTDGLGAEIGSNSWVISGGLTTTGKPLLSNDPHLATSIPSIFTQVGLHCRTVSADCPFDVTGFSFSGMPGVVIGRNASVAWGFTTSYADVQDLYLEQVRGTEVRSGIDTWEPLTIRTEQVVVHGEDQPRTLTIRSSRHGPLVSDVDTGLAAVGTEAGSAASGNDATMQYAVAMAWTALTPSPTLDAVFALDTATDFTQFRAAASKFAAPSQNLTYADTAGNIGYQLNGAIPIRGKGDGLHPSPGWDPAYDWTGTIPFGELPYVLNPPSGYIVSANQTILASSYPYVLQQGNQSYGWRSDVIDHRISQLGKVSPEQSIDLFYDTTMGIASIITPQLLRVPVADSWVAQGQRQLVGWNYRAGADSSPAAYFNVVLRNVWQMTFDDELPEDLRPTGGERWQAVIANMITDPTNWWWDDKTTANKVETRDDILLAAMTQARKELTARTAENPDRWRWGSLHRAQLVHQTLGSSGIAPIEALFNRGSAAVGGSSGTVDALAWTLDSDYTVTAGPTMRMLVDFSDLDASKWVNQSGTSGHAFHRNYDDQLALWSTNQLWDFVDSRPAVEAATTDRLLLTPTV